MVSRKVTLRLHENNKLHAPTAVRPGPAMEKEIPRNTGSVRPWYRNEISLKSMTGKRSSSAAADALPAAAVPSTTVATTAAAGADEVRVAAEEEEEEEDESLDLRTVNILFACTQ